MKNYRAANFHLSRINKIRQFLYFSSVKCVVNALVLSRLDYCNSLYLGLTSSFLKQLQRVPNAAVRTILNLRKHDHVSKHRQSLRCLKVADRTKFKVCLLIATPLISFPAMLQVGNSTLMIKIFSFANLFVSFNLANELSCAPLLFFGTVYLTLSIAVPDYINHQEYLKRRPIKPETG